MSALSKNTIKKYKGKLHEMVMTTPTQYWNDSCSIPELTYAIERGATGATTNPVIVKTVLEKEFSHYEKTFVKTLRSNPVATEDDLTWRMIEHAANEGAALLRKKFDSRRGTGRISIQTNTKFYKDPKRLSEQAVYFSTLAPNMQIKLPATTAGIAAIEEVTYHGASINATVCFTVAQAIAVAEAVRRALHRRKKAGKSNAAINPVCTIMVGRVDDWLKSVVEKENIIVDPEALEWGGVACFKRAYEIFCEKKYETKLLSAAYRSHLHWSQFIGGNIIETIPYKWQKRFNESDIAVVPRMHIPVDSGILSQLKKLSEFTKAYEPGKLTLSQFDRYGATVQTLLQFAAGYDDLVKIIRSAMIRM